MPWAAERISTIAMMAIAPKPWKERGIMIFFSLAYDKIRLDLFKSITGLHIFPEDAVDHSGNGHIGTYLLVYHIDTFTGVVSLRDHVQLQLGGLDRIALADHISECTVAAVQRIAGDQQIAQIDGSGIVGPFSVRDGVRLAFVHPYFDVADAYFAQKARHFIGAIGDQHAEEIVPIFESVRDAGAQGIDIFEDGGILNAINVLVDHGIQVFRRKTGCEFAGYRFILAGKGQIG